MSSSKIFARRLFGGKVSEDCALFHGRCKMAEPVQGTPAADSQLRVDEERSPEVNGEVIVKLYDDSACTEVKIVKQLGSAELWPLALQGDRVLTPVKRAPKMPKSSEARGFLLGPASAALGPALQGCSVDECVRLMGEPF